MGEVGTLCSGLPGCCCGWGQGGGVGTGAGWGAVGERVEWNPPCAGSTGGNGVCVPGPSGDWCACPPIHPHSSTAYSNVNNREIHTLCVIIPSCMCC